MKNGEIITAKDLINVIDRNGAGSFSVNGSLYEKYDRSSDLELDEEARFEVVINFGHKVQFHLVSSDIRAIVTTGLKGCVVNREGINCWEA